ATRARYASAKRVGAAGVRTMSTDRFPHPQHPGGRRITTHGRHYCRRNDAAAAARLMDKDLLMTSSGETPSPHTQAGMNQYAQVAQRFWKENRPGELSQMTNPRAFFSTLGEQVAQQVAALTPQLLAPADPSEPYLRRVGRENAARSQAEEIALNDLIFDWG